MPKTKPSPRPVEQPGTPRTLTLEATATIHLEAAGTGDGAAPLPRFRMVAYTGTPMPYVWLAAATLFGCAAARIRQNERAAVTP